MIAEHMRVYYDFRVCQINTDTRFAEYPKIDGNGRPFAASPDGDGTIDDPETGKRWKHEGVHMGPPLDRDDLYACLDEWGDSGDATVVARVVDNGVNGDGLWLEFAPADRGGRPETRPERWGDNDNEDAPRPLFAVRLTAAQARCLGAALECVGHLRQGQEDEEYREGRR